MLELPVGHRQRGLERAGVVVDVVADRDRGRRGVAFPDVAGGDHPVGPLVEAAELVEVLGAEGADASHALEHRPVDAAVMVGAFPHLA